MVMDAWMQSDEEQYNGRRRLCYATPTRDRSVPLCVMCHINIAVLNCRALVIVIMTMAKGIKHGTCYVVLSETQLMLIGSQCARCQACPLLQHCTEMVRSHVQCGHNPHSIANFCRHSILRIPLQ